ncbi:MAG: bifunctional riboflavin kinase/FAD synthetase [Anaerolineae bacterium]|nr:bifunctional riboflavin kinase/FAD synthetase [Anaerolineae bacterium]
MPSMHIYHDLSTVYLAGECALTIGSFDGVHRGHQALIAKLVSSARTNGWLAGLLTFDPHPAVVLRPQQPLDYLTLLPERLRLLEELGLDFVVVHPFNRETAQTSARHFVEALGRHLGLRELWAGPDFALGRNREGNLPALRQIGAELGFSVREVAPFLLNNVEVRSGNVREALWKGDVAAAAAMLGRPYRLPGRVEKGEQRGQGLGYPTANLSVLPGRVIPAYGIYAAWAEVEGRRWMAAVSIGVRPTFGEDNRRTVEAYLLDFQGDLYGQEVALEFVARLRDELRFDTVADLISQMERDVAQTRHLLSDTSLGFYKELEHTADWAIRVRGRDLGELFAHAAQAMFAMMGADLTAPAKASHDLHLSDLDAEALLVRWLNNLLYLQEMNGELYTRFSVHRATPTEVEATAHGAPGKPTRAKIKAVTFHDLRIEETSEGLVATLVFDV